MREISCNLITEEVAKMCIEANLYLPKDIESCINNAKETSVLGKRIFDTLNKNIEIAKEKQIPICQDTGMVIVFVKIGQEVYIKDGLLTDAINEGVRRGYIDGFLRLSIVGDPINRVNTNDNTPAVIYTEIVAGDKLEIMVAPKGFGSENMSALKMFTPSASTDDIINFVVDTCVNAGSNPCPPIIVGVGIGGTSDKAMLLSKNALMRNIKTKNKKEIYADMEQKMLEKINKSGIGPQGLGGDITALAVAIEEYPTHIAGLPVGVSIGCHVTRHVSRIL